MATRSIVGRFLILAILIVAVGVVAQAALILAGGGKKAVETASATPVSAPASPAPNTDTPAAGDPVRVVYPGPLGDTSATRPKLADAAPASPLTAPAPQTTAKLAQAMAAGAPAPVQASQPAAPAPQPAVVLASNAVAQPDPTPEPAVQPVATPPAAAADPAPAAAGVQVASLGGGAPEAAAPSAGGGIDINTASVATLNHLGGGHIGESIAKHRPYRSVEELVKKRVLRRSVYDQIKRQIAAK